MPVAVTVRPQPHRRPRAQAKKSVREWFEATLRGNTLVAKRGCWRIVAMIPHDELEPVTETKTRESQRALAVNIGDRLLACGVGIDQIQMLEVTSIKLDGWNATIYVSRGAGGVDDGQVSVAKVRKREEPAP